VVGGKHENPLTPATRPQPISEIQQPRQGNRVPTFLTAPTAAAAATS